MVTVTRGGITYFERWGFSINEGKFPNVHISWRDRRFNFYAGLFPLMGRRVRVYFSFPLPFEVRRTLTPQSKNSGAL